MKLKTDGDIELHVEEAGDKDAPAVVFSHGWPELAYSWRHQLPAMAGAGYYAVAPDQRGYGKSSRPETIDDYNIVHRDDDLVALLDSIGKDKAVFVGHDWGSMVVSQMALLHPDRVAGLVNMSVPYLPRGEVSPITMFKQIFGDGFFYILYFQEPGVADADLARDPATTMRRMLAGVKIREGDSLDATGMMSPDADAGFVERLPEPDGLPDWLSQEDLDFYVAEFTRTGFTGGISWYRNLDRNWGLMAELAEAKVSMPALFVTGEHDPVMAMTPPAIMEGWVTDLRDTVIVGGAGHWVQQEKPAEVNQALVSFVDGLELDG